VQPNPDLPYSACRRAAAWQLDEAIRLADEFALCRDGASGAEISRRMLTRIRAVAKRWRALVKELQQRKAGG
jgi:hypothetical protein